MSDPSLNTLIAASSFFIISLILLIIFCFKTEKDLLWMIATAVFVFGSVIADDPSLSSFAAIFISSVILIVFNRKGNIVYGIAVIFALLSTVLSQILGNIWFFAIPTVIIFLLLNKYFSDSPEIKEDKKKD